MVLMLLYVVLSNKGLFSFLHDSVVVSHFLLPLCAACHCSGASGKSSEWFTAILAAVVFVAIGYAMKKYGRLFCDRPRLSSLK